MGAYMDTGRTEHIPVIDLFAGPGGLGEGFSAYTDGGKHPFRILLAVEKDRFAWQTLSLRCFYRQFHYRGLPVPDDYYRHVTAPENLTREELFRCFPREAEVASAEAWLAELGDSSTEEVLEQKIHTAVAGAAHWALIGGPPCQAYSIAGRSRNCGNKRFEQDPRHFLYEEYLRIIARHWPSVFVMENVKGILTSKAKGRPIFPKIREDLRDPGKATGVSSQHGYRLFSLVTRKLPDTLVPGDFVIRCEEYGIPQARHRVIVLGIRDDLADPQYVPPVLRKASRTVNVEEVLTLPQLRSGLSLNACLEDSWENWCEVLRQARFSQWLYSADERVKDRVERTLTQLDSRIYKLSRTPSGRGWPPAYAPRWYVDDKLGLALNHESRDHRDDDLHRYLFAACYAQVNDESPKLRHFPTRLLPEHRNAKRAAREGGNFSDRFRVQRRGAPATTITSHIAKDGHYYIHPDPIQCRSLTVREAARIQTFPDNYFFCGPRTAQYHQVGNAVPPLLARSIARIVHGVLQE